MHTVLDIQVLICWGLQRGTSGKAGTCILITLHGKNRDCSLAKHLGCVVSVQGAAEECFYSLGTRLCFCGWPPIVVCAWRPCAVFTREAACDAHANGACFSIKHVHQACTLPSHSCCPRLHCDMPAFWMKQPYPTGSHCKACVPGSLHDNMKQRLFCSDNPRKRSAAQKCEPGTHQSQFGIHPNDASGARIPHAQRTLHPGTQVKAPHKGVEQHHGEA